MGGAVNKDLYVTQRSNRDVYQMNSGCQQTRRLQ
uniref:Uncharacterized protein n=1 Tax=Utricularia reniformis TaxID=192314 RepID=A0A1Y0AZT7_9LAMI|nr:hypothetical protein AEK19_MT0377 [Utricularia reniformis]ART30649.1 hypothetical protein AEK19_MT0377 [Utricularia reniformis]